jgi:hypothetical protein
LAHIEPRVTAFLIEKHRVKALFVSEFFLARLARMRARLDIPFHQILKLLNVTRLTREKSRHVPLATHFHSVPHVNRAYKKNARSPITATAHSWFSGNYSFRKGVTLFKWRHQAHVDPPLAAITPSEDLFAEIYACAVRNRVNFEGPSRISNSLISTFLIPGALLTFSTIGPFT